MQEPPSLRRNLGWVRVAQLILLIFALPLLAGAASRHLFPRFEPQVAYYLALLACLCLWFWLQERR